MLENTRYLLQTKKQLTVGYFGGSITEGAGASRGDHCYRSRVTKWLRDQYPDASINEIHAAIGGTGSDLGMYRCERDLLSGKPDLVFFEFAVNDNGMTYAAIAAQTETVFRKILRANPYTDIVVIYTVTASIAKELAAGQEYISRAAHATVAHHYGVPSIDVGEVLRARIAAEGCDFARYAPDNVHPNDDGYAVYSETITKRLAAYLGGEGERSEHKLPAPICPVLYEDARLCDCAELCELSADGFVMVEESLCGRYPRYMEATKPGATLSFTFEGRGVGFYWMLAKDSGDVALTVDGGEAIVARSWDDYCNRFNRAGSHIPVKALPYGRHQVTVTVLADHAEQSTGTAIRIGAMMLH